MSEVTVYIVLTVLCVAGSAFFSASEMSYSSCNRIRIENAAEARFIQISADAVMIEPLMVAPVIFAGLLLILLIVIALTPHSGKDDEENRYEEL